MEVSHDIEAIATGTGSFCWKLRDLTNTRTTTLCTTFGSLEEEDFKWYLEKYALSDSLSTQRAERIRIKIESYSKQLWDAVKSILPSNNSGRINIRISDGIETKKSAHSLHWETLEAALIEGDAESTGSPKIIVSRMVPPSRPSSDGPSCSQNILLVSARPLRAADVIPYRLISKSLWDMIRESPIQPSTSLDFVRPGSWVKLKAHLESKGKGYYRLVHFDLHGIINNERGACLQFQDREYETILPDNRSAKEIAELLLYWGVRVVVFNSCNSAKEIDTSTGNMAAVLAHTGIENVIGMSFRAMASSVVVFMTAFYRAFLLNDMELSEAASLARAHMRQDHMRPGRYARDYPVNDSFVPVLYQNHRSSVFWSSRDLDPPRGCVSVVAPGGLDPIGRDGDLLELEAMLNKYKIINIVGEAGVGKTEFVEWIRDWWKESKYREVIDVVDLRYLNDAPSFPTKDWIMIYDNAEADVLKYNDSLVRFLLDFRQEASRGSRLILVSRAKVIVNIPGIKRYSLETPAAKYTNELAHRILLESGFKHTELTSTDAWLHELDEVLAEHDYNPLFTTIFAQQLAQYPESPTKLLEAMQQGPMYVENDINVVNLDESLTAGLAECGSDSVQCLYASLRQLEAESRLAYEMLLSLAPFHGCCNFVSTYYFLKLHERGVLQFENIQLPVQYPTPPGEISSFPSELRNMLLRDESVMGVWHSVVDILSTIGLCKVEAISASVAPPNANIMMIHPLLPYLLQYNPNIVASERSERSKSLSTIFWEYYEFKCHAFFGPNWLGPGAMQVLRFTSELRKRFKTNIRNAARLSLKQHQFGLRTIRSIYAMIIPLHAIWNLHNSGDQTTQLRLLGQMYDGYSELANDVGKLRATRNDLALRLQMTTQFLLISVMRAMFLEIHGATKDLSQEYKTASIAAVRLRGRAEPNENVKILSYALECLSLRYDERSFAEIAPRIEELVSMYQQFSGPYSSVIEAAKLPLLTDFICRRNLTVEPETQARIMQALRLVRGSLSCGKASTILLDAVLGPEFGRAISMLDDLLSHDSLPGSCEVELLYPVLSPLLLPGVFGDHGYVGDDRMVLEQALESAIHRRDVISEIRARNGLFYIALDENFDLDAIQHDDQITALSNQVIVRNARNPLRAEDKGRYDRHLALAFHYTTEGLHEVRKDTPADMPRLKNTYESAKKYLDSAASLMPPDDQDLDALKKSLDFLQQAYDMERLREQNLNELLPAAARIQDPNCCVSL